MPVRQLVGPAKFRNQRQADEILKLAEARLLDRELDFLPAESSLRLEAEDELVLQRLRRTLRRGVLCTGCVLRFAVLWHCLALRQRAIPRRQQLLLADPHGRSHRHIALPHLLFLPQRVALRPALHHPLTLDFHSHISTSNLYSGSMLPTATSSRSDRDPPRRRSRTVRPSASWTTALADHIRRGTESPSRQCRGSPG